MNEIVTERSGSILSIQFNRPEKKNALTMSVLREAPAGLQQDDRGAAGRQPVTGAWRDFP